VAVAGIYGGWRSPQTWSAQSRIQAYAVWEVLLFVLNGLVFVLIGLQLPAVREGLAGQPIGDLIGVAVVVSLAVIAIRFLWVYPATYLPRLVPWVRNQDPYPGWRNVAVVSWTGMRGVVSLAAALSLPLIVKSGAAFPGRDLLIMITFSVILVTLVLQGLSLPLFMSWLGIGADGSEMEEELEARTRTVDAALDRLGELETEDWTHPDGVTYMRHYYGKRRKTIDTRFGRLDHEHSENGHQHEDGVDHAQDHRDHRDGFRRLRQELLGAERATLLSMRNSGVIGDEVMHRVERDLDLEEIRLAQD
jgi:CPA1 family monovalent cation:H+ antiporter